VATWGYGAAFVLAGSIGLGSGGVCRCGFSPQAACGGGWRGSGWSPWVRTSIWSAAVFARALPGRSATASNSVVLSHHTPIGW